MTVERFGKRFIGKNVLVTGAARGIGKTIAMWFAREGARVALNDIKEADLEGTVQELRRYGETIEGYVCDVSKAEEVRRMVDAVLKDFGKIDILVNNAGIALPTRVLDLSEEEWDRVLDINLKGAFLVSQSVLKHMTSRASGRIVMISSIAGKAGGVATGLHYDVSKAGLIVMARRLAREFGPFGVTVNAVAPSFVETDMLKDLDLDSPEKKKATANLNVIKRLATTDDVANAVLFLASDSSSFITGETINVNGGRLMD
jgi:NAD(P)-dependent dehydrogenase (short-subunit alcohol dehydrogenase family)